MRKHLILSLLVTLLTATLGYAQQPDSIYFYKDGGIVYGEAVSQIDSLTFVASDYYDLQRADAIFDELASHPELSIFTWMILSADYTDQLLHKTIWAPTNEALQKLDPNDLLNPLTIKRILNNQICESIVTTGMVGSTPLTIKMMTGKKFQFGKEGDQYLLDGMTVAKSNIRVANSVLHIVDGQNPYNDNIWQYIEHSEGLDSLKAYVQSLTKMVPFIYPNSNTFRLDTMMIQQNDVIDYLAKLSSEDSLYTVVLPDNAAFVEAYARIFPYCKSTTLALQEDLTKWTMIKDVFFRGRLYFPLADNTLSSTSGRTYFNPNVLFEGLYDKVELTNGTCYRTSHLKMFEPANWNKTIRIEMEDYWRNKLLANYYELSIASDTSMAFNVSGGKYLVCKPTTSSQLPSLTISTPIPNMYSMKYNIYVVFVPTYASDTTDKRPFKVEFYQGNTVGTQQPTYTKFVTTEIMTHPTAITKMLVAANFEKNTCTLFHNPSTNAPFMLRVKNTSGLSAAEKLNYNRELRIDYILLEPVE